MTTRARRARDVLIGLGVGLLLVAVLYRVDVVSESCHRCRGLRSIRTDSIAWIPIVTSQHVDGGVPRHEYDGAVTLELPPHEHVWNVYSRYRARGPWGIFGRSRACRTKGRFLDPDDEVSGAGETPGTPGPGPAPR